MSEERWHNFAKEKPSEDMEGRNFIVSNGHYEKIATWCGYWENEPFMGDHLCDEVVRWKFYFTLEEEKANESTNTELKPMKCDELKEYKAYEYGTSYVYDIGEVKEAIAELKARIQLDDDEMAGFLQLEEECGGGDLRKYIAELKQKLEDVQASAYAESVDAGMRERRLRRALWLARAERALEKIAWFKLWNTSISTMNPEDGSRQEFDKWKKNLGKFLKKAEEYK